MIYFLILSKMESSKNQKGAKLRQQIISVTMMKFWVAGKKVETHLVNQILRLDRSVVQVVD